MTENTPDAVKVLERLIATARLLYANAEGCAVNHHGADFELHGMPGWLTDCAADIAAAQSLGARAMQATPADAPLVFTYRNWRGEVSTRRVQPIAVRFGSTEWHPEAQWLLRALDIDKGEEREFAMKDIAASPAAPDAEVEPVAEWEMFRDESHFGMWCVRPKGSRAFGDGFHVVDKAEGQRLLTALNPPTTDAIRAQARREALEAAASLVKQFSPGGDQFDWGRDANSMREAIYDALTALAGKGEAE